MNFKDALKLLHINCEQQGNDLKDLQWVIRNQPSSK